jgi:hypothetical protein
MNFSYNIKAHLTRYGHKRGLFHKQIRTPFFLIYEQKILTNGTFFFCTWSKNFGMKSAELLME